MTCTATNKQTEENKVNNIPIRPDQKDTAIQRFGQIRKLNAAPRRTVTRRHQLPAKVSYAIYA